MSQFLSRAEILLEQGRVADAELELKKHLSDFPEHAYAVGLLARIYLQLGRSEEAMRTIDDALRLDASEGYFYYIKAAVLLQIKNDIQAEMFVGFAVNADPTNAEYFGTWADIKMIQKKYVEALAKADEGLRRDPTNIHCLNTKAKAQVKLNMKEGAYQTIEGALNEEPDNPHTHANYGWGLLEKGEHQKALIHFREALRLDPGMDYARAGMVEAMKAKYIVYRWFLNYQFWMSKQSKRMQWGIIIGIFVLSEILQGLADSYPEMEVYLFPLIVLIALLAFSTWVIGPLSDLFLRLNKYGRYALSEREVKVSNLVGIAAAMFALGVILFIPTFNNLFLGLAVYGFTMMVPLSNVYSSSVNAVKLNRYALALAVLGIFGLIEILLTAKMEGMFVMIYLMGFIGYQWAANFWNQGKY